MPTMTDGYIKKARDFFRTAPFEKKRYAKYNGVVGLLMLPGILVLAGAEETKLPFPPELIYVPISVLAVMAGGFFLATYKPSLSRYILVLQGSVICLLVFLYTLFMWYVAQLKISGKWDGGLGHAPGILAWAANYGMTQIVAFSGQSSDSFIYQRLPAIFLIVGLSCDLFIVFLMLKIY